MTQKAIFGVRLKSYLYALIITNGPMSQFAPYGHGIAETTTGLPCRTMVQICRPMQTLVHGRRSFRENMVRRTSVEEVANWLCPDGTTTIDHHG
jgi:hypothetical protein